jgi:hypothetical protein
VNPLAPFWRYRTKVYDLPNRLRAVRDTRLYPEIPTAPVSATLFLGAVLRSPSTSWPRTAPAPVGGDSSSKTRSSMTI